MPLAIDRSATVARTADATLVVRMQCCFVVDRDLFSGFDVAQRSEENVVVNDLHEGVRITRVIDVMRAVAAATPIETPAIINFTDPQHASMSAPARFRV